MAQSSPARSERPIDSDDPDVVRLLTAIVGRALHETSSECGAVLLLDEESGDLCVDASASVGPPAPDCPSRLSRSGAPPRGLAFRAIETREPFVSGDLAAESDHRPLFQGMRSHLSVPVIVEGRPVAALVVESSAPSAFGPPQAAALAAMAAASASGVRRAQIFRATASPTFQTGAGILIRGLSPTWRDALRKIERAAGTNATVLLRGESGTGKEVLAHAIHYNSPRARNAFVVVNCAAIPEGLLESELFGHVRGAFTGAVADRRGRFEEADGGTVFLDEVAELSPALQVKLLRVAQTGEVTKVGGSGAARRVDVRLVAATNRPLERMMREGTFREDLFFRLNVVSIRLPPLREYLEAVPDLARSFLLEFARAYGRPVREIHPDALAALLSYAYPGNVRELRNMIEQGVVLESGDSLRPENLPDEVRGATQGAGEDGGADRSYRAAVKRFERAYLVSVLASSGGDVGGAAGAAKLHRVHLYRLIRRHGLRLEDFRRGDRSPGEPS